MPVIRQELIIKSTKEICFDLSRSICLHKISTSQTKEEAIAGVTSGLIGPNETVTWRAKHLGVWQKLTVKITEYNRPHFFVDEMAKGAFHSFRHEHHFEEAEEGTLLIDVFDYKSPLCILGRMADKLFLKEYMRKFLANRNNIIKHYAESGLWHNVLAVENTLENNKKSGT